MNIKNYSEAVDIGTKREIIMSKKSNNEIILHQPENKGEIVLYQPDDIIRLDVWIEEETVWLTQAQMVILFERDRTVITKHINNIFKEGELDEICNVHFLHIANSDKPVKTYNLDVIISVGYRIKSHRGTSFRRWATKTLKDYILKGYAINQKIERVENFVIETERRITETENKINFLAKYIEEIFADYNDINEDTRLQLELINETLAKLQSEQKLLIKPRNLIGYKRYEN